MPNLPKGNRPDTSDPYSNPVLGALRNRVREDEGKDHWVIENWNSLPNNTVPGSPEALQYIEDDAKRRKEAENIWLGKGTVKYSGDWLSVGFTEEGAQRLLDALVACFKHEGITPHEAYIVPPEVSAEGSARTRALNKEFGINIEGLNPLEFETCITFVHVAKGDRDTIDNVVRKISAASRKIQEKQAGKSIE